LSDKNRKSLTPAEELRLQKLETKKYWLEKVKAQEKAKLETKKEVKSLPASDKNRKSLLKQWTLTPSEELRLQKLETKKHWLDKIKNQEKAEPETKKEEKLLPVEWKMLNEITLYPWQKEAVDAWLKDKRGTIEVVTGAGKTILALAIIEKLQREIRDLCVAIVVPTIVLLNQWHEELLEKSNLPEEAIGFLGAGSEDSFKEKQKRILICVLNSASKKLPDIVDEEIGNKLLLVVDECHRAGASEWRQVFNVNRSYVLGLSATPERDDLEEDNSEEEGENNIVTNGNYSDSFLGKEIGPIVYEMSLKQAFDMGILPGFEIRHYGLSLSAKEREKYDQISQIIQDLNSKLKEIGKGKNIDTDRNLWSWCQNLSKEESRMGELAHSFIWKTRERKSLLYNAKARREAVISILKDELKNNPNARAILFHEKINEVMNLFSQLLKKNISVVAENSQLPVDIRNTSIELFRHGIAKVIVSARSLIEGFNVPGADIGIIVASSTSVRQRIQTLGRVLRKTKIDGKEKKAIVYVLYMAGTTDEYIYEKTDWNKIIGAKRNRYFSWDLKNGAKEVDGPPRNPRKYEDGIDETLLEEGGIYPGEYEGDEYSCDYRGNVFNVNATNKPAVNPQGIPEKIYKINKQYGRFKVTPQKKYILLLKKVSGKWQTDYVTTLKKDFIFQKEVIDIQFDPLTSQPGDEFPRSLVDGSEETIYFKQRGGGSVIAKKHPRGELYARSDDRAEDKTKGENASKIIEAVNRMQGEGFRINKLLITKDEGHVIYLKEGKYHYVITIKEGLEFSIE